MRIHFIAIGGAAMHNLAIALKDMGHHVSGSDDQIFDPSKSRLEKKGLLPDTMGWHIDRIDDSLDAVILGMHARKDNPELAKALELGLKVYSYPEFIYQQSKDKKRVVIAGSHGKTTITSMILHVLKKLHKDFDFLVGAQIEWFDNMVRISDAPVIVLEGDEYLSSPIDRRPKFHLYHPHIALISGIAWDHINVFPTFENYLDQFETFIKTLKNGTLVYYEGDPHLVRMTEGDSQIKRVPYRTPENEVNDGVTSLKLEGNTHRIEVFGDHNLQNLNGARLVCAELGISTSEFMEAIADFTGAARRLERVAENEHTSVYKDFAHSPSKLKATTEAVKQQWPDRHLVACMELHTFSSLTKDFLKEYNGSMHAADEAIVFYKEETLAQKKLPPISEAEVKANFSRSDLAVFTKTDELLAYIQAKDYANKNLLMMSSGNFGGVDVNALASDLVNPS